MTEGTIKVSFNRPEHGLRPELDFKIVEIETQILCLYGGAGSGYNTFYRKKRVTNVFKPIKWFKENVTR